jgi:hypothetical protein
VKAAQVDPGTITHQRLAFPEGGVDSAAHRSARALKIILKVARKNYTISSPLRLFSKNTLQWESELAESSRMKIRSPMAMMSLKSPFWLATRQLIRR